MIDYWSKLKLDECWSKKERFNKVMNYINSEVGNEEEEEEVEETQYGKLSINVSNLDEQNVGSAVVSINDTDFTGTTGSQGGCNINNIPYGTYTMTVECEGYSAKTEEITIDEEVKSVNIVLNRIFSFVSYADEEKETEWGQGTVTETGVISNDYSQVEVLTNSTDQSFVGQTFYIVSNAVTDGNTVYPLYTDDGTTLANIFVTIQQ